MTDNDKQRAREALAAIRAGLANPHGFGIPDFITADSEPIASGEGCYVFKLTPAIDGLSGFILEEAAYPLYRATYQADLTRAISIIRGWQLVLGERRMQTEREARKRR